MSDLGVFDENLTLRDIAELKQGTRQVFELMKDGLWHSAGEIRKAAAVNCSEASEGLRRFRELRGLFETERRIMLGSKRTYEYRLVEALAHRFIPVDVTLLICFPSTDSADSGYWALLKDQPIQIGSAAFRLSPQNAVRNVSKAVIKQFLDSNPELGKPAFWEVRNFVNKEELRD